MSTFDFLLKKGRKNLIKAVPQNQPSFTVEHLKFFSYSTVWMDFSDFSFQMGTHLLVCKSKTSLTFIRLFIYSSRQKTDMDSQALKRENNKQLGSRVFGDCDRLFKKIMRNLYDQKEIEKWEGERCERMEEYNSKRDG